MLPSNNQTIFIFLVVFGVVAAGMGLYLMGTQPETSPVFLGGRLAVTSGCFACHGRTEPDSRINFRQLTSGRWRDRSIPTLWENGIDEADELVEWIREGCPADEADRHRQLFIQMPPYGDRLSPAEIDAIAAWILAEALRMSDGLGNGTLAAVEPASDEVRALDREQLFILGDRLSRQQGCYQCHGELGQGGLGNPDSFKGAVPGFFGAEFLELTAGGDRDEIRHWIDHGRGNDIEAGLTGFLATRFFDGQAIGMPAYAEMLSDGQKALLVEYLLLLNEMGPLNAHDVENLSNLLTRGALQSLAEKKGN